MFGFFRRKKKAKSEEVTNSSFATAADHDVSTAKVAPVEQKIEAITGEPLEASSTPVEKIPQFEEVFEVISAIFEPDPMDGNFDVKVDETSLRSVSLALCQGQYEYLSKLKVNPSDQDKALRELGKYLERMNVYPVGYTQWTHSESQGIAARVLFNGRNRTALIGPIHAMARATTKFPPKISELVEGASARGHNAYVLGIDGLAYGAFEVTHALREVK